MRKTGPRWFGFAVPLACLSAMLMGQIDGPIMMIALYMFLTACSLNAPDAFSRAAAGQMSTKKVMGSLIAALILTIIPTLVIFFTIGEADPMQLIVIVPVALLVISRCFEELFASQNDSGSAAITTVLTATFLGGALCLVGDHSFGDPESSAELLATGVAAAVSGSIALGFSRKVLPIPGFAILKHAPAALARLLLYPALCIGLLALNARFGLGGDITRAPICCGLIGLIFLELTKTTFRRGKYESTGLKTGAALTMLCATCGLIGLSPLFNTPSTALCQAIILAAGAAAMLLYAPFDWESITATLVMLAASALSVITFTPEYCSFPYEILVGPIAGLILCGVMFRQWQDLARRSKANQIRKKAMKKSRS